MVRNHAKSVLRGPLLVRQDQLREAYALLETHSQKDPKIKGLPDNPVSITVELRDEERYTLHDPEDVFKIENRKRNPITSIRISSRPFAGDSAKLALGSYWFQDNGAVFEVSGDIEENQTAIRKFKNIFDHDKDLLINLLSLRPILISLAITICLHVILGLLSAKSVTDIIRRSNDIGFLINYVMFLWIGPALFIDIVVRYIISGWIGRAIFLWDSGEARYNNKRIILLFPIYTLPVAVLTKVLAGQIWP